MLYFKDLDKDNKGKITNDQFLDFPFFKYSPYREFLPRAFMLKDESEIAAYQEENLAFNKEDDKNPLVQIEEDNKTGNSNRGEIKQEQSIPKVPYIDFKEFVKYLFIFSYKAPNDQKLQCTCIIKCSLL